MLRLQIQLLQEGFQGPQQDDLDPLFSRHTTNYEEVIQARKTQAARQASFQTAPVALAPDQPQFKLDIRHFPDPSPQACNADSSIMGWQGI